MAGVSVNDVCTVGLGIPCSFFVFEPTLPTDELVVFGLGSAGLSVAGLFIEQFALTSAQTGRTVIAVWAAAIGCVVLAFAYIMATDKAAHSFAKVKHELTESTK